MFGGLLRGVCTAVFPDTTAWSIAGQLPAFVERFAVTRLTLVPSVMWAMLQSAQGSNLSNVEHPPKASTASSLQLQLRTVTVLVLSGEALTAGLLTEAAAVLPVRKQHALSLNVAQMKNKNKPMSCDKLHCIHD